MAGRALPKARFPLTNLLGAPVCLPRSWEGEIEGLSLQVVVYEPDGRQVFQGWGGLDLTHDPVLVGASVAPTMVEVVSTLSRCCFEVVRCFSTLFQRCFDVVWSTFVFKGSHYFTSDAGSARRPECA